MFLHAIYLDDKKRKFYFDSTWTFDNPNNSTKCMMGNIIHDEVFKLKYYENVKFSIKATILYWPHHGLLSICVLWMYIIRNVLAMDVYHAISKEEFDINRSYYIKWNPLVEINCDINRINLPPNQHPTETPLLQYAWCCIFLYADHVILGYIKPQMKLMKPVGNSVCADWGSSRIIIRLVWPWNESTANCSICLSGLFYPTWRPRRTVISEWRCDE